jgi:DNA-binding MarR family transcriptional regulator
MSTDDTHRTTEDVVAAYHRLRSSEASRQARVRSETGLGDNELKVLKLLLSEGESGHAVMPSEIARHLGVSSASTTALLDRLERAGALQRVSHPTDRRSILVAPTATSAESLTGALGEHDRVLHDAASGLDERGRTAVVAFLESVARGADAAATPQRG